MFGGFSGGPGFGALGFGGGPGFGGGGFGSPGFGFGDPAFAGAQGFGGPGLAGQGFGGGFGGHHRRAILGTAALLLDGPADAAQLVQRVSEVTDGAFTPPQEFAEVAIGLLAGRGVVTVTDGTATLTELGRNLLAWRGVSSDTTHALLKQASKFIDLFKIRKDLFEVAGLARTIAWTGTEQQKEKLAEAKSRLQETLTEIKQSLHGALAEN